jgi:hypothetical protein
MGRHHNLDLIRTAVAVADGGDAEFAQQAEVQA